MLPGKKCVGLDRNWSERKSIPVMILVPRSTSLLKTSNRNKYKVAVQLEGGSNLRSNPIGIKHNYNNVPFLSEIRNFQLIPMCGNQNVISSFVLRYNFCKKLQHVYCLNW